MRTIETTKTKAEDQAPNSNGFMQAHSYHECVCVQCDSRSINGERVFLRSYV